MPLVYREDKGAPLTNEELDGNFKELAGGKADNDQFQEFQETALQAFTDIGALLEDKASISAQSAAIGTYALVANITAAAINGNVVVPGSSLAFIGPVIYSNGSVTPSMGIGSSPAGSWRLMGWGLGARSGSAYAIGLAKRVS